MALRATMPLVIAGLYVDPEVQDRIGEQLALLGGRTRTRTVDRTRLVEDAHDYDDE